MTAPDLRILAMSAALPVSGAAVTYGAERADDVADLDDVDATAGAAFSIVTTVRGLGTAFGASERASRGRLGRRDPRCFDHTNNPMRERQREGEEEDAGRSEQRRGHREENADGRVLAHGLLERGPCKRGRLRATPRILAAHRAVPVRVVICLNRENILRPGSVLGRAAWHAWCLERNSV